MDEKFGSNIVVSFWKRSSPSFTQKIFGKALSVLQFQLQDVGVDLSEFYMSVEWDILEVPAVR